MAARRNRRAEHDGPGLFGDPGPAAPEWIGEGACVLRGFAAREAGLLVELADDIAAVAPFRHLETPGGRTMSIACTNCGEFGWHSDRSGYRYATRDPSSGRPWPTVPDAFLDLASRASIAAGHGPFRPDSCLINRYEPGNQLTLHQDRDESDFAHPIVSVSLGLPARFLFGGAQRSDRPARIVVEHGDVVVWGGSTRLHFHGVTPLADGNHPVTGRRRLNLTFRHASGSPPA